MAKKKEMKIDEPSESSEPKGSVSGPVVYRIAETITVRLRHTMAKLNVGKLIDSANYDVPKLKSLGVKLEAV